MGSAKPRKESEVLLLGLRFTVLKPPPEMRWALQLGRQEGLAPRAHSAGKVVFDVQVKVVRAPGSKAFRLRGPAVQDRPGGRFVYLSTGSYAGDATRRDGRRAKVSLEDLTASRIAAATTRGAVLEAQIAGTGRDGGAACASVKLLGAGWTPV
jgi:Family of unknown function (DUF5990)